MILCIIVIFLNISKITNTEYGNHISSASRRSMNKSMDESHKAGQNKNTLWVAFWLVLLTPTTLQIGCCGKYNFTIQLILISVYNRLKF